jgi:hypothetical protein
MFFEYRASKLDHLQMRNAKGVVRQTQNDEKKMIFAKTSFEFGKKNLN